MGRSRLATSRYLMWNDNWNSFFCASCYNKQAQNILGTELKNRKLLFEMFYWIFHHIWDKLQASSSRSSPIAVMTNQTIQLVYCQPPPLRQSQSQWKETWWVSGDLKVTSHAAAMISFKQTQVTNFYYLQFKFSWCFTLLKKYLLVPFVFSFSDFIGSLPSNDSAT